MPKDPGIHARKLDRRGYMQNLMVGSSLESPMQTWRQDTYYLSLNLVSYGNRLLRAQLLPFVLPKPPEVICSHL